MLPLRGPAASPGEPPPPSPSSTPSPGLSRPRLVKQRKHGASARAKPVSVAAYAAAFNPFRTEAEDSGFRSGLGSDSGRSPVVGASGDGRGDVFLFGSGMMKSSDDALREGTRKLWISEQNEADLHGSSISIPVEEMRRINIRDGDSKGKSDDPNDDRGVFGQIPRQTRKMEAVSGNAESAGNSRSDRLDAEVIASDMRRMNLGGRVGDAGGDHVFVFGDGKSAQTASEGDAEDLLHAGNEKLNGEDIASRLPEDMEKLRIGRAGEDVGFGKKRGDGDSESKVKGDIMFVFGSGKSYGSTYVGNAGSVLPVVSESHSGSIDSRLPDDMKKLDRGSSGSDADTEKMRGSMYIGSKLERRHTFVFGSNKNSGNSFEVNATNILPDNFKANDGSHGENTASMPEEILKSKLEIPGSDADLEMRRGSGHVSSKPESEYAFVFGSDKNVADPFANDTVNTFPYDIKNLNIGAIPRTYSMKDGKNEMEGRYFTSASMSEKDHASKRMPENFKNKIDLPNDMQRLRIGEFAANASGPEIQDKNRLSRGNNSSMFWNEAVRDNSVSVNKVRFKGLSVDTKNTTGQSDKSFSGSEDISGNSTRYQFSFQAGSRFEFADNNINASFSQNDTDKASYGTPTAGAGFRSVTSDFTFIQGADGGTILKNFSWTSRDSLFSGVSPNIALNVSMGSSKDSKKNKRRNNLRQPASYNLKKDVASPREENNLQEKFETGSTGSYSPMDFSPYENLVYDQCQGKPSVASDESAPIDSHDSVGVTEESSYLKSMEDLVFKAQSMAINEFEMEDAELNDAVGVHNETSKDGGSSFLTDQNSGLGPNSHQSASDINSATYGKQIFMENPIGSSTSDVEKQASDVGPSVKFSANDTNFSFAAKSGDLYSQGPSPALKQLNHRKNKSKMAHDSRKSNISSNFHLDLSSANLYPPSMNLTNIKTSEKPMLNIEVSSTTQTEKENECAIEKNPAANRTSILTASANDAVLETCEKWRLRGNQAYADGNVSKAEEYYTCGVDCVPPEGSTSDCKHALMLCYSNRAASRMSLGRMREALQDCSNAIAIDSCFLKAHVRAANSYLALGEAEDASLFFKKCCQLAGRDSRKILEEAADGLKKAQQVEDYICRCADLLKKRSADDASNALLLILDATQLSPYSERLIEMKADALFLLRRYEEVIKHCEQTMDSSKKNAHLGSCEIFCSQPKDGLSDGAQFSYAEIWRWNLISKSYFYLGRLEEALSLFEKNNLVGLSLEKCSNKYLKSLLSFMDTLQELVRQKAAGNNAFQASRHSEAIEHYTSALGCSTESRPYAAICFCNRAAAYQALGQVSDAIADCSLAIALDGAYAKAISRRATLHEKIRDYSQAINDLNRLILLLEKQMKDSFVEPRKSEKSSCEANDLKRARQRLATLEDEARKGVPLDLYMILGVDPSSNAADIKKAYRKAALRHHPDKACQLLARSENSDDGLWKEVADEVHKDADRLFKMIGEAYAILSDRSKRLQYDTEEEMRETLKHESGYTTPKRAGDSRSSYPEKSSYNWQSWNTRRPSGSSQQWWSESSRSSRQF